jgi:hypothetical protein
MNFYLEYEELIIQNKTNNPTENLAQDLNRHFLRKWVKRVKRHRTLLVLREMQTKTRVRP